MRIRFRRMWRHFKAKDETDAIPDGIATTLIRIGAARLVEETPIVPDNEAVDEGQPADDSDGADDGTSDAGGGEEAVVHSGHKQRRRNK